MLQKTLHYYCFILLILISPASAQTIAKGELQASINNALPQLEKIYLNFHQNPELSLQEKASSTIIAKELSQLGFNVTENIGGYGVVGLYKNGVGPTIMIRADMDALPITEQTNKPYASTKTTLDRNNNRVGIMHACGHDIHMTVLLGTAEELGTGANAMLKEGLFKRFALPDEILALHSSADLAAGTVGIISGPAMASVDSIDITVKGIGGHGAYPQMTKDPIVLASRIVLALQTIASREISPLEPNVMTVGAINGGTKYNIIPDEVKLQLTLRSYNPDVKKQQILALKRLVKGIAISAGLPENLMPQVKINATETSVPPVYNDPTLSAKVTKALVAQLGQSHVIVVPPVMAGEDFGLYGLTQEKRPMTLFWLGAVNPKIYAQSKKSESTLPSLHSSVFAPDYPLTIDTGVQAMTAVSMSLFNQ
ncbi:M20 metallopeptidase family protein [Shewanella surugensis]|uniref:M20/M25/M40 family metallo-hydrolase n=1 Tax=Shewanella surugensis TaxID=212020 RepID=A0ABT0LAT1_9GAMM|nr:M20/M25/M40 family metallo-hydrolase [Shewanella surugensis]MCL1124816.1 M20/M25/M40 family metallo-hydrolase [Shewanella surugensis]